MRLGVWFYSLATIATGVLNIVWGAFDASHQPVTVLGISLAGQHILAYIGGVWLIAAGVAILWRRSERIGAAACGIAYGIFAAFWLARYYTGVHALGWRIDVILGVTFGVAQQVMLISPAVIVYASGGSPDSLLREKAGIAARWMLGLPPISFGIFHIIGLRVFATIVPQWMGLGYFWAALTGVAFLLAGIAICAGVKDVMAARLLALMLLLFEGLVEAPPIVARLHDQPTWGAAVYNLTAIGACWIFAEFALSRRKRGVRTGSGYGYESAHRQGSVEVSASVAS